MTDSNWRGLLGIVSYKLYRPENFTINQHYFSQQNGHWEEYLTSCTAPLPSGNKVNAKSLTSFYMYFNNRVYYCFSKMNLNNIFQETYE